MDADLQHSTVVNITRTTVSTVYKTWAKEQRLEPYAIAWPDEGVRADDTRNVIGGPCALELKYTPRGKWRALLLEAIDKTKAHAIFLAEQTSENVLLTLESRLGTISWVIPIQKSGDRHILGDAVEHPHADSLGLLRDASS